MRRAILMLAVTIALCVTTVGCQLMFTPAPPASPATPPAPPASTPGTELPVPSIKDLGSPDPPATVQPIATP